MGLNTNSSFIPSSYFCKGTMNPCKIQIFRYSFKGDTVLSLRASVPTIQRAVSAKGDSEMLVRSFLLLFQSANYLIQYYPGRCPGLISYWAFSPSLQRANPLFKVKQQNFKPNEATEVIFLIIATERHGTTRTCREIT